MNNGIVVLADTSCRDSQFLRKTFCIGSRQVIVFGKIGRTGAKIRKRTCSRAKLHQHWYDSQSRSTQLPLLKKATDCWFIEQLDSDFACSKPHFKYRLWSRADSRWLIERVQFPAGTADKMGQNENRAEESFACWTKWSATGTRTHSLLTLRNFTSADCCTSMNEVVQY